MGASGFSRALCLCAAVWLAAGWPHPAWPASDICASDDEEDAKAQPAWKKFALAGACVEVSGDASVIYQNILNRSGGHIPALNTQRGPLFRPGWPAAGQQQAGGGARDVSTFNASFRIDTTRKTAAGDLTTGFEIKYEKTSDDGGNGLVTLIEGVVSWAGLTAGYTDSLMNFWSGDFQFSATAPKRTVGVASYDIKLSDAFKLTLAAETGVPTSREGNTFAQFAWDDPVAAARLSHETDDLTLQWSAMYHELMVGGGGTFLAGFGRARQERLRGWAATFGLTKPLPKISEGSEFSMQATYAVNASPYLGTAADLSLFSGVLPVPAQTRGWSVVGSYHHVFSEHWEANVMASHLALDIILPHGAPEARMTRYAANLIWKPAESLKLGGELGWLDLALRTGRAAGFFPNPGGSALVGYLFATWTF
jgi:hypothetical protein